MKPTSYSEINSILEKLLIRLKRILGDRFVGMYLSGSLAYGDFSLKTSDVDLVVVAKDIPKSSHLEIRKLSRELLPAKSKWRKRFEVMLLTLDQFKRGSGEEIVPNLNLNGRLLLNKETADSVIQRYIIKKNPVVLAGPSPQPLIGPITRKDLRKATLMDVHHWWKPKLKYTSYLKSRGYRAYAVLTMCRILYTLAKGEIVSKPVAAQWAIKKLGKPWADLIERSLNRSDNKAAISPEGTLAFVKLTVEHSSSPGSQNSHSTFRVKGR